jgi:hypothetical protein
MKKKPIKVYYSYVTELMASDDQVLFNFKPESLMSDIKKKRVKEYRPLNTEEEISSTGYHVCTALHEMLDNAYILKAPFDAEVYLDNTGAIIRSLGKNNYFFGNRMPSFENYKCVDFKLSLVLFSEEDLDISLLPPFFHKGQQPEYGFLSFGKFNIASWFRPVPVIFHLWEGSDRLYFNEGDPIGYINFHTNRRIQFEQFQMTPNIQSIVDATLKFKYLSMFEPLSKLYERFRGSGMRDRTLKEIKENII